jgi:glycosyltransferase involved in cell wall biosynthesis
VFNVRHNSDVIELDGSKKEILMEKVINKMSSHIIAISNKVKDQLINKEGVNSTKIYRINNGYDFGRYNELSVDISESERIRNKYKSKVLIVSPGRLIKTKRHKLSIEGVKELVKIGIDAKLLILGEGPEKEDITKFIVENAVEENVFQLGYIENISDYLMASDIVVLLSNSEASSNIVKEAAYYEKPVIVCENVGDFSDYIVNGESGSLVSKDSPKNEFISIISDFSADNSKYTTMAKELKRTVLNEFSIEEVGKKYEELQSKLVRK